MSPNSNLIDLKKGKNSKITQGHILHTIQIIVSEIQENQYYNQEKSDLISPLKNTSNPKTLC